MSDPIRVAVTGAAGNIGYSILFRIASGQLFGPDQMLLTRFQITVILAHGGDLKNAELK